jgi:hypothetical protein
VTVDQYDVSAVVNPWQAAVLIVLIIVVLGLPQVGTWRNSRQAKTHAREARDAIRHEAQPNSGSSMKDALNRIEGRQVEQGQTLDAVVQRVAVLEQAAEKRGRLTWRRRR